MSRKLPWQKPQTGGLLSETSGVTAFGAAAGYTSAAGAPYRAAYPKAIICAFRKDANWSVQSPFQYGNSGASTGWRIRGDSNTQINLYCSIGTQQNLTGINNGAEYFVIMCVDPTVGGTVFSYVNGTYVPGTDAAINPAVSAVGDYLSVGGLTTSGATFSESLASTAIVRTCAIASTYPTLDQCNAMYNAYLAKGYLTSGDIPGCQNLYNARDAGATWADRAASANLTRIGSPTISGPTMGAPSSFGAVSSGVIQGWNGANPYASAANAGFKGSSTMTLFGACFYGSGTSTQLFSNSDQAGTLTNGGYYLLEYSVVAQMFCRVQSAAGLLTFAINATSFGSPAADTLLLTQLSIDLTGANASTWRVYNNATKTAYTGTFTHSATTATPANNLAKQCVGAIWNDGTGTYTFPGRNIAMAGASSVALSGPQMAAVEAAFLSKGRLDASDVPSCVALYNAKGMSAKPSTWADETGTTLLTAPTTTALVWRPVQPVG